MKRLRNAIGQFIAPIIGLLTMLVVLAAFNAQYLAAQYMMLTAPTNTTTVAQVASATDKKEGETEQPVKVAKDPKVIVPKIGVDAPVIYGMNSIIERDVQRSLQDGVLHYADTPKPGQRGNGIYVGHSSNVPWVAGNYKFVFAMLERIEVDDVFYLNYDGIQYAYKVTSKRVVSPNDVTVLAPSNQHIATLITCTPVGTSLNRLVVTGEQISPTPPVNREAKTPAQSVIVPTLPGNN